MDDLGEYNNQNEVQRNFNIRNINKHQYNIIIGENRKEPIKGFKILIQEPSFINIFQVGEDILTKKNILGAKLSKRKRFRKEIYLHHTFFEWLRDKGENMNEFITNYRNIIQHLV